MNLLGAVYLLLVVANILCIISGKNHKYIGAITTIFLMLFLAGIRYNGSVIGYDLRNYEMMYNQPSVISSFEFGFKFINYCAGFMGLSFEQFHFVIVAICIISIVCASSRMNSNINLVMIAYLLYFCLPASGQLKNLCAMSIFVHIFPIPKVASRKFLKKEVALLILASSFHFSFVSYFILLIINIRCFMFNKQQFYKIFFTVVFLFSLISIGLKSSSLAMLFLQNLFGIMGGTGEFYSARYLSSITGYSSLATIAITIFTIFGILYWRKVFFGKSVIVDRDSCTCKDMDVPAGYIIKGKSEKGLILPEDTETILGVIMLSSVFFPLVILNASFYRLIRDLTLVAIIHLGVHCNKLYVGVKKRMIVLLSVVGICCGWFLFDVVIKGY